MTHAVHLWRNPRVVDAALAVLLFVAMSMVGDMFPTAGAFRTFEPWSYVLSGLVTLPLAARRSAPLLVLFVTSAAYVVFVATDHLPGLHLYAPMLAFYSVAAQKPPLVTAFGTALTVVVGVASAWALSTPVVAAVVQVPVIIASVWWLGNVARQLADATEQLRREQQAHVERMLTQERLRIARELHDVVAHHMSVISLQAGLADYVFDTEPATARTAVHTIGATSHEALDEMRRLLNLLRVPELGADAGSPDPVPRLGDLTTLVERVRAAGVEIDLELTGDLDGLPSGLQLTVYRIVQEAVTNMIKYAGPCRAEIVVRRQRAQLTATISNDRRPDTATPAPGHGGGYGLMGMRERASLYQGTVTAGPDPDGRYTVKLTVPLG